MLHYVLLAGLSGFLIPLQALINARIASYLTGSMSAAFTNFAVGLIALTLYFVVTRSPVPSLSQIASAPLWAWAGGLFGAFFIFATVQVVPRLGTGATFAIVIAMQLVASLIFDHFGVLHPAQPISAVRVIGALFLLAGVYLIMRPQSG